MWKRAVVVVLAVSSACGDDGGGSGPGEGIDASWTLMMDGRRVTCDEAFYESIRITATPVAGGEAIHADFPCTVGGRLLAVPPGDYRVTADGIASAMAFDRPAPVMVTVDPGAATFTPFTLIVSEPMGQLHVSWAGTCDGAGPDSVRLDVPDGAVTSVPCIALQLTSGPIPLGAATARLVFIQGSTPVHTADLPFELTMRGQVLDLPRVDLP